MNIDELRGTLSSLKIGAKPKKWNEAPQGMATSCGHLFTCCIENGQLALAVSRAESEAMPEDRLVDVIVSVFGEPRATWQAQYAQRGATTIYQWNG